MRRERHHDMHIQRKGYVRTPREGGHLPAKERGLRRNQTCQHLDLGLPVSNTVRSKCLFFKQLKKKK